jgi:DNA polymerase-1
MQTVTRTGRISSIEPNIQNIPVRTERGRIMRKFFRAKAGAMLIDADYSQIELRVLAHISDDEIMKKAFAEDEDIHTITAAQVFNQPTEWITPELRTAAKAVNFGIVYGIGAFSLAKDINVSVSEAKNYIESYLAKYKGVKTYMDTVIAGAKETGFVATMFGRRRHIAEIKSSNKVIEAAGKRIAQNTPIQGTAADTIKLAMIRVYRRISGQGLKARLILQVHDELIVEAPMNEMLEVEKLLKEEMESAAELSVKLQVDVRSGKTWYDSH